MVETYARNAELLWVTDGDTVRVLVDLGMTVHRKIDVRLKDVWAAERNTPTGLAHTAAVRALLPTGSRVVVRTYKDRQTFGRYVADLWLDGQHMNPVIQAAIGAPQGTGAPE